MAETLSLTKDEVGVLLHLATSRDLHPVDGGEAGASAVAKLEALLEAFQRQLYEQQRLAALRMYKAAQERRRGRGVTVA